MGNPPTRVAPRHSFAIRPFRGAAGALAGVAVALVAGACSRAVSQQDAPQATTALTVRRGDFGERVLLTGELTAERAERMTVPRSRGWQVQIRHLERHGEPVKKGQRVVSFDNSALAADLEDRKLAVIESESELQRAIAEAAQSAAEKRFAVAQAQVSLERAKLQADVPPELLPAREAQERRLALHRAEVALAKAEDDLAAQRTGAEADLEVRRIALEKTRREIAAAEEGIAALELGSPGDGLLLIADHPWQGRRLQVGDMLWPGLVVAEIPDLDSLRVTALLPDVDDGRVTAGMTAECVLDAWPEERRRCRVREVAPLAEEEHQDSLRRFIQVLLELEGVDPARMRPGMSVRVEVMARQEPGVLLAPRLALDLGGERPRARRADGWTEVELGPCDAQECVVRSGLDEGQELARAASAEGPA
jgi:HlyD family secretion protein